MDCECLKWGLNFSYIKRRWIQCPVCDRNSAILVNWLIFDILEGLDFIVCKATYYTAFSSFHQKKKMLDSQKLIFRKGSKFEFDFRHKWMWSWEEYSAEKWATSRKERIFSLPWRQSCQRPFVCLHPTVFSPRDCWGSDVVFWST